MVCLASGAKSVVKSFIATRSLQHKSSAGLGALLLFIASLAAAVGYWAGFKTGTSASQLSPSTIRPAFVVMNANADGNSNLVNEELRETTQGSETEPAGAEPGPTESVTASAPVGSWGPALGQLHADILSLRILYRRLAEQAGVDLTDFTLDEIVLPMVPAQPTIEDVSAWNTVVDELQMSSSALASWYQRQATESTLQLSGPVVMQGSLSSGFGWRNSPQTGERRLHKGVDYRGNEGEPILALADGVVSFAGRVYAYGNMVELLHADGFRTRYAHNQVNSVVRGQRVQQGQIIARLGSTGRSTGPHVHVEVHLDGEALDPMLFFQ